MLVFIKRSSRCTRPKMNLMPASMQHKTNVNAKGIIYLWRREFNLIRKQAKWIKGENCYEKLCRRVMHKIAFQRISARFLLTMKLQKLFINLHNSLHSWRDAFETQVKVVLFKELKNLKQQQQQLLKKFFPRCKNDKDSGVWWKI